ncbi:MAG TPA: PIG-L family deacetylase [Gemmatimonadaceae bacterium]|jgi:LmbE family N-acetylglucosaminyl deacetylase
MRYRTSIAAVLGILALCAPPASAQARGAGRLAELVHGLTVTPRVLIVGAHPDDADPELIAWLARGHMVETGYLSLTRGESGQNYLSADVGSFLGAVRTEESIAARGIDGGQQFFTRAYDFGFARNVADVFKQWPRDSLLGDVVTVIRSFRPQVLVLAFNDSVSDGNGQHDATIALVRDAFNYAGDTVRFPAATYGAAWEPAALYRHGGTLRINASEYNPVLGETYADIALESLAEHRSQGLVGLAGSSPSRRPVVLLSREVSRAGADSSRSIFDGIDTSFARLGRGAGPADTMAMNGFVAYADSARQVLDVAHPASAVHYLALAARFAYEARKSMVWCRRPAAVTLLAPEVDRRCTAAELDRDASIDIARERVTEALLLAAGVDVRATADQELLALKDTITVSVELHNHGSVPVTLGDVFVDGVFVTPTRHVVVAPDSVGRAFAAVHEIPDARPWWFGQVVHGLFAASDVSIDGLTRTADLPTLHSVSSVAMPEELRRVSDATVVVTVDGVSVTTSAGPITFRNANPLIGVQERPVSGVPAVTLSFPRGLEWVAAHTKVERTERLSIESFSNVAKRFRLQIVLPGGLHLDVPPESVTLAPRERREVFLRVHGMLDSGRVAFGAAGHGPGGLYGGLYIEGFQGVEYPHIPPIRVFRSSGFWLQTVNVTVPPRLTVAYVPGPGDDIALALRDIGITVTTMTAEELPAADLSYYKTLVIGPRAFDAYPALAAQRARVLDFARQGGTVVMLQQEFPLAGAPYPLGLQVPRERVTSPNAPVTVLDAKARLLTWPNRMRDSDWVAWSGERAAFVPSTVEAHYTEYLEMHDPEQPANRNTLLSARVGKGTFVYTSLSLQRQITLGVPGALRLLVNMLCAGQSAEPRP